MNSFRNTNKMVLRNCFLILVSAKLFFLQKSLADTIIFFTIIRKKLNSI